MVLSKSRYGKLKIPFGTKPVCALLRIYPQAMRRRGSACRLAGSGRAFAALRQAPVLADEVAGVDVRMLDEVILVFGLRFPKRAGGGYFGHHLAGPETGGLDILDRVERRGLLRVVGKEDRGAVAHADV